MKDVGRALAAGLRAPFSRCRLVLLLWAARILPIVLLIALPVAWKVQDVSAHDPDARYLLNGARDSNGYVFAWTGDFFRDHFTDMPDRVFWLVVVSWMLVTFLAGGIVSRLVGTEPEGVPFLVQCGRFVGRFLRLGLIVLGLFYVADVGINTFLSRVHADAVRLEHTQDYRIETGIYRGLLFMALLYLLGLVHSYARIDLVARDRRSAFVAFFCGLGTLLTRLPKLFLLEGGLLLAAGVAAVLAWLGLRQSGLVTPDSGWISIGIFMVLAAVTSYLRTGIELGAVEARCRLLIPVAPEPPPRSEIIATDLDATLGEPTEEPTEDPTEDPTE